MLLAGCDRGSEWAECNPDNDPGATPGRRVKQCPTSEFLSEDIWSREVYGRVRRGEELVEGALVQVDRTSGGGPSAPPLPLTTVTDKVGYFSGLRAAPLRYDISARMDDDVIVYRGVGGRYFEPSIDVSARTFARAFTAGVDIAFDRPTPPDHSIAYFASGDEIFAVNGDAEHGLSVLLGKYTKPATLHAVEYETAGGLQKATAYAKADVVVDAGERRFARFAWAPITRFVSTKFIVKAPPGFVVEPVDVLAGVTPTSDARLVSVPNNTALPYPVIPNMYYSFHARATRADGAVTDSGESVLNIDLPEVEASLEASLPTSISPAEGETRGPGDVFVASGEKGVFEHLLVSQTSGPTVRMVTRSTDTILPDVTALGAAAAAGPYTWTVRAFPTAKVIEDLSGLRPRRYRPMTVSAPRTITLR